MSKCPICNTRKGKRKCLIEDGLVCSLCCGKTRSVDLCLGCQYYQKPKINYNDVPAYTISEMDGNTELEAYGNAVEGALCSYDIKMGNKLKDTEAIKIIESLIDVYHFGNAEIEKSSQTIFDGVDYIRGVIESDLEGIDAMVITKILGVIRFVARRRTQVGREYMGIIQQYVGMRVGKGIRALNLSNFE